MKIKLAKAMGTCFGVRDAVHGALQDNNRNQLTIAGQLVHNPQTVGRLKDGGIAMITNLDDVAAIHTQRVMITAHGASNRAKQKLKDAGFQIEDATCPLVQRVHDLIKNMEKKGLFPVVIGQPDHVEVKGIVGDLKEYFVVLGEQDLPALEKLGKKHLGIVSQTTNQSENVEALVAKIRKLPSVESVEFNNTVCKPTRDRQTAARELAEAVDVMIVIGGYNSSNTKKLLRVCAEKNVPGYHIEGAHELKSAWFQGDETVGITAGTSTPEDVIQEVYAALKEIAVSKGSPV